jgi:biopolymer transport protein ExbB
MDTLIYVLLGMTSIVGLAFIVERALALRWNKVVPPEIAAAVAACATREDMEKLRRVCEQKPSALGRLLLLAADRLDWPKDENVDALQTAARHEIVRLERGLVVLEIIIGIAPLLGLVGTIIGMMTLFDNIGAAGLNDASRLANGIGLILKTTLIGLLIAIPALISWSYFSKKVEVLAVEMEALCDDFIRRQYANSLNISDTKSRNYSTPSLPSLIQPLQTASPSSPQPPSVLFPKRAARYSVLAPLICLVNGSLTGHLQHTNHTAGIIIGLISISLLTSGLVFGIKALISCKRNKLKGVFGWAITGICLNGFLLLLIAIGLLLLFITGFANPNVAHQILSNQ